MRELLRCWIGGLVVIAACAGTPTFRRLSVTPEDPAVRLVPQPVPDMTHWFRAAITPDGRLALLGDMNGAIWVWDIEARKLLRVLRTDASAVKGLAAAAGGRAWAAWENGTLCAYDLRTITTTRCGRISPGFIVTAEISADATRLGVLVRADKVFSQRARLLTIDLASWEVLVDRDVPEDAVATAIAFDPWSNAFATVSDRNVFVWPDREKPPTAIPIDGTALAFTSRGLVVARRDFALELRTRDTGALVERVASAEWAKDVELSNDVLERAITQGLGTRIGSLQTVGADSVLVEIGGAQATVVSFAAALRPPPFVMRSARGAIDATAYAPTSNVIVAASDRGREILIFDAAKHTRTGEFELTSGEVTAGVFTERGLFIGGQNAVLRFDPTTGIMEAHAVPGRVTAISGDGRYVTVSRRDTDSLELWSVAGAQPTMLRTLHGFAATFACKLDGPGCKLFLDSTLMMDAATGGQRHRFASPRVSQLAVSADARRLVRVPQHLRTEESKLERIDRYAVEVVNTTNGALIGTVRTKDEATALALSDDGILVAIVEGYPYPRGDWPVPRQRLHVMEVASGKEILTLALGDEGVGAMAFTPDRKSVVIGGAECHAGRSDGKCRVSIVDIGTKRIRRLGHHENRITQLTVSPDGNYAVSVSWDGTARIWWLDTAASTSISVAGTDWVMYSDDGVFDASRYGASLVAAVKNDRAFSLDQFAAVNNRPDVVMSRMGFGREDVRCYFESRHRARLERLGIASLKPTTIFDEGPQVQLQQVTRTGKTAEITAVIASAKHDLSSYQVWINRVPLFPGAGKALRGRRAIVRETVELASGDNHIEVGARGANGVESLRAARTERYQGPRGEIYFAALGVSAYRQRDLELGFAAKDAVDLTTLFAKITNRVHTPLVNEQVTVRALDQIKSYLSTATVDDTVVVFVAGHGVLSPDDRAEFLFVPFDFDRERPLQTTIPFSSIESIFAGLKARRRLLLIDSCVSGERDEATLSDLVEDAKAHGLRSRLARTIAVRTGAAGPNVRARIPREYVLDRDRLIFNSIIRGEGVVALGSSRWNELSYEHEAWENGAFTAELKRALTDASTDRNRDGQISFDELAKAVASGVARRTSGLQHPTVREDNVDADLLLPLIR